MTDLFMDKTATLSACGLYRYSLTRKWGSGSICTFIMLNPSTADANVDDPTIRRCIGFARREKCGGLLVVNLFAFRATDPKIMMKATDPIGPANDGHIRNAISMALKHGWPLIAAWSANKIARDRGKEVAAMGAMKCLKITNSGAPGHPLYLKADSPLIDFGGEANG